MIKVKMKISGTETEYEGEMEFLENTILPLLKEDRKLSNENLKIKLLEDYQILRQNMVDLDRIISSMAQSIEEINNKVQEFSEKLMLFLEKIKTSDTNSKELIQATKEMQEMNMSFSLQYLQFQNKMQNENRQFTIISNVMKTKHDTAKSTINNIR